MTDLELALAAKSDQLNAIDLITGPRTVLITDVVVKPATEQPIVIRFEGDDGKPYKPSKGMARWCATVWRGGADKWVGQSMTLYYDPSVKYGGKEIGGIRISHMTGISEPRKMSLCLSRGKHIVCSIKALFIAHPAQVDVAAMHAAMHADAKQAAGGGKDAFAAWWNTEYGKTCREHVTSIMTEIQEIVAKADAETNQGEEQ